MRCGPASSLCTGPGTKRRVREGVLEVDGWARTTPKSGAQKDAHTHLQPRMLGVVDGRATLALAGVIGAAPAPGPGVRP